MKVQRLQDLADEMLRGARGEIPPPKDAAEPSFESAEALVRLLTPENRQLLGIIRDRRPASVSELARMSGRAEPNVSRTLAKLAAVGLVDMRSVANKRVPVAKVGTLRLVIDPYSMDDRIEITPA